MAKKKKFKGKWMGSSLVTRLHEEISACIEVTRKGEARVDSAFSAVVIEARTGKNWIKACPIGMRISISIARRCLRTVVTRAGSTLEQAPARFSIVVMTVIPGRFWPTGFHRFIR